MLHARALPGNPYDGHTLGGVIEATEKLTGCPIERAYVDKGYRATKPQPRGAYSSQARNVASSESSNASSGAAQPSSLCLVT